MRTATFILLCLFWSLAEAGLEKKPEIPVFPGSSLDENVSTYNEQYTKEFEWFVYDLSEKIKTELSGEYWILYYRTSSDIETIKELLTEEISKRNGEVVLDINNNFTFLLKTGDPEKRLLTVIDFFSENFRVQVMNFDYSQIEDLLKGGDKESVDTKFFTENSRPDVLLYFDQKAFSFPQKYSNDISEIASILKKDSSKKVYIFGYADPSEGDLATAREISNRRVLGVVKNFQKQGIKDLQIVYKNRSTNQQYNKNLNGKEFWQNRRVELFLKAK